MLLDTLFRWRSPLSVTELPLFCIQKPTGRVSGKPVHHLALKQPEQDFELIKTTFEIEPFSIQTSFEFQLMVLKEALLLALSPQPTTH